VEVIIKLNNMIDKRIEEAANKHIETEYARYNSGEVEEEMICLRGKDSFKEGANWAINEFLKNLWHHANKIPKKFNHYGFAALYILQYNHQIRMVLYDKDNMSWKNVISNSEYWLYVDDLLPKQEGGEQ
jgi:hypothetical protein